MGKIWLPTGGSGGLDPDELTADASDVLKGKTAGINGNDEPAAGTLELTGTADDSDVLSGKTYYNTDAKQKQTGSMPENGPMNASLNCGQSKTIPAGYTTGGIITANSLASQTSASASAGHILSGQTAWVNGNKITGNMPERGGYGGTGNSQGNDGGNQRFYMNLPNGHYNENARAYIPWSNVRSWAGLTPDKIKKNVSIMGIIGSNEGFVAGPYDLYNRGAFGSGYSTNSFKMVANYDAGGDSLTYRIINESSQLKCTFSSPSNSYNSGRSIKWKKMVYFASSNNIQFTPYNTINITFNNYYCECASSGVQLNFILGIYNTSDTLILENTWMIINRDNSWGDNKYTAEKTVSLNVSSFNGLGNFKLSVYAYGIDGWGNIGRGGVEGDVYINRIWLT